jgi:hypothetical protein
MKKATAVLVAVVMVVSLVSLVFAADAMKVTIKGVDAKAGTVVYTSESGKDETKSVDKSVDLGTMKAGDKVMITVDKDMITSMKADAAPAAKKKNKNSVGC